LAIVKKIVEEHGGSVSVKSSSSGATFELRLPQAAPEKPVVAAKKQIPARKSARPVKGAQVKSPSR
jgi:hypothetical protein